MPILPLICLDFLYADYADADYADRIVANFHQSTSFPDFFQLAYPQGAYVDSGTKSSFNPEVDALFFDRSLQLFVSDMAEAKAEADAEAEADADAEAEADATIISTRTVYDASKQALEQLIKPLKEVDRTSNAFLAKFIPSLTFCCSELVVPFCQEIEQEIKKVKQLRVQAGANDEHHLHAARKALRETIVVGGFNLLSVAFNPLLLNDDGKLLKSPQQMAKRAVSPVMQACASEIKKLMQSPTIAKAVQATKVEGILQSNFVVINYLVQVSENGLKISQRRTSEFTGDNKRSVSKRAVGSITSQVHNAIGRVVEASASLPAEGQAAVASAANFLKKHETKAPTKVGGTTSKYQLENNAKTANHINYTVDLAPVMPEDLRNEVVVSAEQLLSDFSAGRGAWCAGVVSCPLLWTSRTRTRNPSGYSSSESADAEMYQQDFFLYRDFSEDPQGKQIRVFSPSSVPVASYDPTNIKKPESISSFQIGIPISALMPVWMAYFDGKLSLEQCCNQLQASTGIVSTPASILKSFDLVDIIAKPAYNMLKHAMWQSNHVFHMDETPFPLYKLEQHGHYKKKTNQYVVIATSPKSADLQATIFERVENRTNSTMDKVVGILVKIGDDLISDKLGFYKSLAKCKDGLNQFCGSHLLRNLAEPMMTYFKHMFKLEDDFLNEAKEKAAGKQGNSSRNSSTETEEQRDLSQILKEYVAELPPAVQHVIHSIYYLILVFAVERHTRRAWSDAMERSWHYAEFGRLTEEERTAVLSKILEVRQKYCAPLMDCLDEALTRAQHEAGCKVSGVKEAVGYYLNDRNGFRTFLTDPEVSLDNNDSERGAQVFSSLRKIQRINQSEASLDRSCHVRSLVYSFDQEGFDKDFFPRMLQYMLDKLFRHTIEQAATELFQEKGNLDGLQSKLYQLSFDKYLFNFPFAELFFGFLNHERKQVLENTGKVIPSWPTDVVQTILELDRLRISSETKDWLAKKAENKADAAVKVATKAEAKADVAADAKAKAATVALSFAQAARAEADAAADLKKEFEAAVRADIEAKAKARADAKAALINTLLETTVDANGTDKSNLEEALEVASVTDEAVDQQAMQ